MKLIYLASMHNSGSTVISLLANSHPEIVSPGEMYGPGGRHHGAQGPECSCGVVVAKCPFWHEVSQRYMAAGHSWTPTAWGLHYRVEAHPYLSRLAFGAVRSPAPAAARNAVLRAIPSYNRTLAAINERNRCFAQAIADVSGKAAILDASKHPARVPYLSRVPGIDFYLVHLIRDPRGWCNSRKKAYKHSVARTARQWVSGNRYIERLARTLAASKRTVLRYEEFCADPQAAMDRLARLASLPTATLSTDLRTISHHLLGNRMRNRGDAKITQDKSWRQQLSHDEIDRVCRISGSVATRYGYNL